MKSIAVLFLTLLSLFLPISAPAQQPMPFPLIKSRVLGAESGEKCDVKLNAAAITAELFRQAVKDEYTEVVTPDLRAPRVGAVAIGPYYVQIERYTPPGPYTRESLNITVLFARNLNVIAKAGSLVGTKHYSAAEIVSSIHLQQGRLDVECEILEK